MVANQGGPEAAAGQVLQEPGLPLRRGPRYARGSRGNAREHDTLTPNYTMLVFRSDIKYL